jgi:uncharacterized protein YacL
MFLRRRKKFKEGILNLFMDVPITPEYSDFYKFLTSFGLFLFVASIFVYLLFLNSGFNAVEKLVADNNPEKLSQQGFSNQTIQQIINFYGTKVDIYTESSPLVFIICFIMIFIGVFLFYYGFIKWKRKQEMLDLADLVIFMRAKKEKETLENQQSEEREMDKQIKKLSIIKIRENFER